ncbi:UDP-3-O-[3-hydroxymyristoyl] glucosamine N-acyltransferase [hydrothermal vent metagenome]|uniref:UDP-3-O-[3-hydroxymyristoyl] glucosamine N-acyltransferase n=1 Tax=hydrothermal vent metagenome TaxID=652676 RepID=A0A3B0TG98_9ZZZZ
MVDQRFFGSIEPASLAALLIAVGADEVVLAPQNAALTVCGANTLDLAGPKEIALAVTKSYTDSLKATRAGAVIVTKPLADMVPAGCVAVISPHPRQLFVRLLDYIYPAAKRRLSLRPVLDEIGEPKLEEEITLGANAIIGSGAEIGSGSIIGSNTVIGPGVTIGRNTSIGANVTVECSLIGDNVIIHPGAAIGVEGFGWIDHGRPNTKVPQLGRTILQSGVEVGANACIDRGALGDTIIGQGTKIGGLVEIGHNCQVGNYCLIAPTSALAGGTILGDSVLMGAGSGAAGHLSIGSHSVVHARSAVTKDWPAGSVIAGLPAQEIKNFWREMATLRRLTKKGDTQ